ncbi:MAG: response regulator transcription factor [Desulfobacterales bacterium]|nr:response regulator transcription factor [Desulfobacterales bacterium]
MKKSRIMLADKHANMLGGICRLLEDEAKTVLMVADERSLYDALESFHPDVVLVDQSLPFSGGINIASALKRDFPNIKIIILSLHEERSIIKDAMAAGADGFVLKRRAVIDLIPAIREVLEGRKYISSLMNGVS